MMMWLCVIAGTIVLGAGGYGGMKLFGYWAMKRDEADRAKLQEEWKRRAAARKAQTEGPAPPEASPDETTQNSPPL